MYTYIQNIQQHITDKTQVDIVATYTLITKDQALKMLYHV